MLLLTRLAGQSVDIDGGITVTVMEVRAGGVVMLGFRAPADTHIVRTEIADQPRRPRAATRDPRKPRLL